MTSDTNNNDESGLLANPGAGGGNDKETSKHDNTGHESDDWGDWPVERHYGQELLAFVRTQPNRFLGLVFSVAGLFGIGWSIWDAGVAKVFENPSNLQMQIAYFPWPLVFGVAALLLVAGDRRGRLWWVVITTTTLTGVLYTVFGGLYFLDALDNTYYLDNTYFEIFPKNGMRSSLVSGAGALGGLGLLIAGAIVIVDAAWQKGRNSITGTLRYTASLAAAAVVLVFARAGFTDLGEPETFFSVNPLVWGWIALALVATFTRDHNEGGKGVSVLNGAVGVIIFAGVLADMYKVAASFSDILTSPGALWILLSLVTVIVAVGGSGAAFISAAKAFWLDEGSSKNVPVTVAFGVGAWAGVVAVVVNYFQTVGAPTDPYSIANSIVEDSFYRAGDVLVGITPLVLFTGALVAIGYVYARHQERSTNKIVRMVFIATKPLSVGIAILMIAAVAASYNDTALFVMWWLTLPAACVLVALAAVVWCVPPTHSQPSKKVTAMLTALVVFLTILMLAWPEVGSYIEKATEEKPVGYDETWEVTLGVYVCDGFIENVGGTKSITPLDETKLNPRLTVAEAMEEWDVIVGADEITLPDGTSLKNGYDCNGVASELSIVSWQKGAPADGGLTRGFELGGVEFRGDGEMLTIAVVPEGTPVPQP